MIPGPDIILACPKCSEFSKLFTLTSGNTFWGVVVWTDGMRVAPMLPRAPTITACHACEAIFWVKDAERVGEISSFSKESEIDESWKSAPFIRELSESQCHKAITAGFGTTREKELYLRVITWWRGNDRYRYGQSTKGADGESLVHGWSWRGEGAPIEQSSPELEHARLENMRRLFALLNKHDEAERMVMAEISRELGEFDRAIELLNGINGEKYTQKKLHIFRLCSDGKSRVSQMSGIPS